jgi:hypothetical protein
MEVDASVILFSRFPAENDKFVNEFSVHSPAQRGAKGRAIVRHEGWDTGAGIWTCSKDALGDCAHKRLARDHLQKLLKVDPAAVDNGTHCEEHCMYSNAMDTTY